jgi:HSP20 family protein
MRTSINLDLLREVDAWGRQFEQLFSEKPPCQRPEMGRVWQPAIELEETENSFVLRVEVPGLQGSEIDVQGSRFQVAIAAHRKPPHSASPHSGYLRSELRYGPLSRVVPLPKPIVPNAIAAALKDGILTLTLPKFSAQKPQVVKVRLDEAKPEVKPVMPREMTPKPAELDAEGKNIPSEDNPDLLTDLWATRG